MQLILDASFIKSSRRLPKQAKQKLATLLPLLKENPNHPLLHSKKLKGIMAGLLSFRITREWRVLFYFADPDTIHLLEVDHRKDIYR